MEIRGWHRELVDAGTALPVPAGRRHREVTPDCGFHNLPGLVEQVGDCRSSLNLQILTTSKWTPSYTSATLLPPHSHYPAKALDWASTPIALKGSQAEGSTGNFDIPPGPQQPYALLLWDHMTNYFDCKIFRTGVLSALCATTRYLIPELLKFCSALFQGGLCHTQHRCPF